MFDETVIPLFKASKFKTKDGTVVEFHDDSVMGRFFTGFSEDGLMHVGRWQQNGSYHFNYTEKPGHSLTLLEQIA